MRCSVEINGMKLRAFHGVLPEERVVGNLYVVDLRVDYPFDAAMISDNIEDTLNYVRLTEIVTREMLVPSSLLEHVAGRIIKAVGQVFPSITSGRVRIAKTVPPLDAIVECCAVAVEW